MNLDESKNKSLLNKINLAVVLYGSDIKFHFCHEDQALIIFLKKYKITKCNCCAKVTLDFKTNRERGLFLSLGEDKSIFRRLFGKTNKAWQILQDAELSSRNNGPSFHNLTFLLMLLRYPLL